VPKNLKETFSGEAKGSACGGKGLEGGGFMSYSNNKGEGTKGEKGRLAHGRKGCGIRRGEPLKTGS